MQKSLAGSELILASYTVI